MGFKALSVSPERAAWKTYELSKQRPNGLPDRPLRAVLVGGQAEHGNVGRLPDNLWNEFGICVVSHVVSDVGLRPMAEPNYDVAVVLTDGVSASLQTWGRSAGKYVVQVPSSWSRMKVALHGVGILAHSGMNFRPDIINVRRVQTMPPAPEVKKQVPAVPRPAAVQKVSLPPEVAAAIRNLKDLMVITDVRTIELNLDGDDTLMVRFEQITRTSGTETI